MLHVDDKPETLHIYVVRQEAPKPQFFPIFLSVLALASLIALSGLDPYQQPVTRAVIRVPAVPLGVKTFTASVAVIPTGIKTYPSTTAHGVLTITNGSIIGQSIPVGFTIQGVATDSAVYVPGGNANGYGWAQVQAHAVVAGKNGDLAAYAINSVIGSSVYIRNLTAFSGGLDSYSVKYATAQDKQVAITKFLIDSNIPSPTGGKWNERTVRMIIERAQDLYQGIAYAYKYEFSKEYKNGKLTTVKRVRPVDERLLLPEGTVPRIIDPDTARLALAAAGINTQESLRNNVNTEETLLRSGYIRCGRCGNLMSMRRHKKSDGVYLIYRCPGLARAARTCEHIEISAPKIDAIVWKYLCGVIKGLEIIEEAVSHALEADAFTSPERAAEKAIAECQALITQYREDLKTTGLSNSAQLLLLEDLIKQTELLDALQSELVALRSGRLSYERVMQEYQTFLVGARILSATDGRQPATRKSGIRCAS